jgi:DNA-binding NarL/FixJ family response regulator
MPARVLIADDHRMFREGVARSLPKDEFPVVGQAADGQEAVRLARRLQPELALIDVAMPGLNGVDATREVRRVSPGSGVVVLTMHEESPYVTEALRAGARGYVLKTQSIAELLDALRQVQRGNVYVSPGLWRDVVDSYRSGDDARPDPLTPREREVLQLIAEGHTTKQIADALHISFKTAESHRSHLMTKLDIHVTAGLVRYAIRRGLVQA